MLGIYIIVTYAVVGHDPDFNGVDKGLNDSQVCGQAYEIQYDNGLIVVAQAINTSAGGPSNFDIYMPAGGYGVNNACFPRAYNNFLGPPEKCNGNECTLEQTPVQFWMQNLYDNSKRSYFYKNVPWWAGILPAGEIGAGVASQTSIVQPWGGWQGGIRGAKDNTIPTAQNQCYWSIPKADFGEGMNGGKAIWQNWASVLGDVGTKINSCLDTEDICNAFQVAGTDGDVATQSVRDSCKFAWNNGLHFNNKIKRVRRVQVPANLGKVTGLKRNDTTLAKAGSGDQQSSHPSVWRTSTSIKGVDTPYTQTTMEDCCKATCQNSGAVGSLNGDLDPEYNCMYTCNDSGIPFVKSGPSPPSPPGPPGPPSPPFNRVIIIIIIIIIILLLLGGGLLLRKKMRKS